jgi:hypothetical protein
LKCLSLHQQQQRKTTIQSNPLSVIESQPSNQVIFKNYIRQP